MKSRTAIVFLTWERLDMLKKTIKTFRKLNGHDYDGDMIIVDNGSSQSTIDFLHKFQQETKCKLILNGINLGSQLGKYIGWNAALENEYDFVLFLEDDFPSIRPTPIKQLEAYLDAKENQDVGYVRLNDKPYLKRHQITKKRPIEYQEFCALEGAPDFRLRKSDYHFTCNPIIFRTSLVPFMKGATTEKEYMKLYMKQYDLQAQLHPPTFKTIEVKRRASWQN